MLRHAAPHGGDKPRRSLGELPGRAVAGRNFWLASLMQGGFRELGGKFKGKANARPANFLAPAGASSQFSIGSAAQRGKKGWPRRLVTKTMHVACHGGNVEKWPESAKISGPVAIQFASSDRPRHQFIAIAVEYFAAPSPQRSPLSLPSGPTTSMDRRRFPSGFRAESAAGRRRVVGRMGWCYHSAVPRLPAFPAGRILRSAGPRMLALS